MIIDKFGRRFTNLRVSLTSACNYACEYCVPSGQKLTPSKYELPAESLLSLVRLVTDVAGIKKLRITGGEPLIAPGFSTFISSIDDLYYEDVSLTTNGQFLCKQLRYIVAAGIKRINVSLDSLEPLMFQRMAKGGDLAGVLSGIDAALDAGLRVKINMVPMQGLNNGEVVSMLKFCMDKGIELRFIELMQMGHYRNGDSFNRYFYGQADILAQISQQFSFYQAESEFDATAQRYKVEGGGSFGIIANSSQPFCQTCSRLRLSAEGELYGCLSSSRSFSIRHLLDMPYHQSVFHLQNILQQSMQQKQSVQFSGEVTVMKIIGG